MEIVPDPLINELLSKFRLGIIQSEVDCKQSSLDLLSIIDKETAQTKIKYRLDDINKIETIAETRNAYKKLGNDPNRYRPSADSLLRRIVKGIELYNINNVVDTLNLISIQSGFSIGGYDLQAINEYIRIGIGETGEPYKGIGRGDLNIRNLPVLRDRLGAFGTPTSDSERTMIKDTTSDLILVFYDFGMNSALEIFLSSCSEFLSRFCSARNTIVNILTYN